MIRLLLFFLLLFPIHSHALIDYQLDVILLPAEQRLIATALITPDPSLGRQIELRLSNNCTIVDIHQAGEVLSYSHAGETLSIKLNNRQPLSISYQGKFSDQVISSPVHNEDPSYGVTASIAPIGSYLSAAANWYPRLTSEALHYRVSVTAPLGIEAVSSGRRVLRNSDNRKTHSVWEIDYPLYGLTLSAGNYQVFEDSKGRIPIYAYFYAESATLAATYLKEARSYLQLYEELFGPYPFNKFAIVENFFPTGYGLPSWTLLGSSVIKLPFIVKTSLGHEIAHSWWGTGVRVDYAQGNWAEGLTTYVADYLYQEQNTAAQAYEYRLKVLREYASLVTADNRFPLAQFRSRHDKASQSVGYGKAAMLFHMLRKKIGEEYFWRGLKTIAQENMFQSLSWSGFADYFSALTGSDLQPFFKQWLQRVDGPRLSLQHVELTQDTEGFAIHGELVQTAPYYQLTVELQAIMENESIQVPIKINTASQGFRLNLPERPLALLADPAADLFRILDKNEIPPTVNTIRGSNNLIVVTAAELAPSVTAQRTLLGALRKLNLPVQKLNNISTAELATHDLLIFGASSRLNPEGLKGAKITLEKQEYALRDKSAFIVQPHPLSKDKTAAWFLSADSSTDAIVARKIPHYGKYSYLLFDGKTNRAKGTLAPAQSPLRVEF